MGGVQGQTAVGVAGEFARWSPRGRTACSRIRSPPRSSRPRAARCGTVKTPQPRERGHSPVLGCDPALGHLCSWLLQLTCALWCCGRWVVNRPRGSTRGRSVSTGPTESVCSRLIFLLFSSSRTASSRRTTPYPGATANPCAATCATTGRRRSSLRATGTYRRVDCRGPARVPDRRRERHTHFADRRLLSGVGSELGLTLRRRVGSSRRIVQTAPLLALER